MTRAYISLLSLDLGAAFYYNPLFPLPPVILLLYFLKRKKRLTRRVYDAAVIVSGSALIALWLLRMFFGDGEVVYFRPENGFFVRLFTGGL